MNSYVELVKAYPMYSAMIQFAILGTFGDVLSKWMQKGKVYRPYKFDIIALKMLERAILAVTIKYAFVGFLGFVENLGAHHMLPELNRFGKAFSISVFMNIQFGIFLVIFHRFLDNLIAKQNNWKHIEKSLFSLVWFWIPAHTLTFMLDKPYQIGLAAVWSVVLGFILGYYNREIKETTVI